MDLNLFKALAWLRRESLDHALRKRGPRGKGMWILLGILSVYLAIACFLGGQGMARLVMKEPAAAGRVFWRIPLVLGVMGALWDGGCLLAAEPFAPRFVKPSNRLLAELGLGLLTPFKRVLVALGLCFLLGMGSEKGLLCLCAMPSLCMVIVWVIALERVLFALVPGRLLKRRALLLALLILGLSMVLVGTGHGQGLSWLASVSVLEWFWFWPGWIQVQAWRGFLEGRFLEGLKLQGLAALSTFALLLVSGLILVQAERSERAPGLGGLWRFRRPWLLIARLQFHQLMGSRAGQLRMALMLVSVPMVKEPELLSMGNLHPGKVWIALAAAMTFGSMLIIPLCNLLGFDRSGVKSWWLLPLKDRELLLGKVMGSAAYAACLLPLLLLSLTAAQVWRFQAGASGLVLRSMHLPWTQCILDSLALSFFLGTLFLWCAGSGLQRSLRSAWPMELSSYGLKLSFDEEKIARLGMLLAPIAWMVPLYGAVSHWGNAPLLLVFGGLGLVALMRLKRRLDHAEVLLAQVREELTAVLSAR